MSDVTPEELEAIHKWNCAMLVKRKNRAAICKSFCGWHKISQKNKSTRLSVGDLSNNSIKKQAPSVNSVSQSALPRTSTTKQILTGNQQLEEELNSLLREQNELENATARIKCAIREMPRAPPPQQRNEYSLASRYSSTKRFSYL